MNNLVKTIILFGSILLLISCKSSVTKEIGRSSSPTLHKFSKEAFNYFYEVCFYEEVGKKQVHLAKWKSNVTYFIAGNPSKWDIDAVDRSISKLNNLGLSINFELSESEKNSNVIVYFGDSISLKKLGLINHAEGMSFTTSENGIIKSAKILISDHSTSETKKESVILEEMTQILGLNSDSYRYPKSLFYEGFNSVTNFQPIDVEVIQLLYDSLIPFNYCIKDYEKDFGEIINYCNTSEKLRSLFTKNNIQKSTLKEIKTSCYLDGEFYKHPKDIPVLLSGFNYEDSAFVQKALAYFNSLSNNINLKLIDKIEGSDTTGISITLTFKDRQEYASETRISNSKGEVFKPKRIKSIVNIDFRSNVESNKKLSVILKSIYKSLGPTETHFDDDWWHYDNREISMRQKYVDIITTIYSDEFVDGYPMREFEELIESL